MQVIVIIIVVTATAATKDTLLIDVVPAVVCSTFHEHHLQKRHLHPHPNHLLSARLLYLAFCISMTDCNTTETELNIRKVRLKDLVPDKVVCVGEPGCCGRGPGDLCVDFPNPKKWEPLSLEPSLQTLQLPETLYISLYLKPTTSFHRPS